MITAPKKAELNDKIHGTWLFFFLNKFHSKPAISLEKNVSYMFQKVILPLNKINCFVQAYILVRDSPAITSHLFQIPVKLFPRVNIKNVFEKPFKHFLLYI